MISEECGIAFKLLTKLEERAECLFVLADEGGVVLEVVEEDGVVNMKDGDARLAECLAEEHVLVAVVVEVFVEGITENHLSRHHEVGCAELLIALCASLPGLVGCLATLLVAVAEVGVPALGVASDGDATDDDGGEVLLAPRFATYRRLQIAGYEVGILEGEVAVDEDEPGIASLAGKEVADGRASDIGGLQEVSDVRKALDGLVLLYIFSIGRSIIGHNDLVGDALWLALPVQLCHKSVAQAVVGG